jgi:hypothetical protein
MLCLPYYAYVFSTKLELRAEQVLPGSKGEGGGKGWGRWAEGRNDPTNVHTCEEINNN